MTNLDRLNLAAVHASTDRWPGAIEDALDPEPRCLDRVPVFVPGDRVLVPATPGAIDLACKRGGPGEVVGVREYAGSKPMIYVVVDDSTDGPQPYRADELRREPTL